MWLRWLTVSAFWSCRVSPGPAGALTGTSNLMSVRRSEFRCSVRSLLFCFVSFLVCCLIAAADKLLHDALELAGVVEGLKVKVEKQGWSYLPDRQVFADSYQCFQGSGFLQGRPCRQHRI